VTTCGQWSCAGWRNGSGSTGFHDIVGSTLQPLPLWCHAENQHRCSSRISVERVALLRRPRSVSATEVQIVLRFHGVALLRPWTGARVRQRLISMHRQRCSRGHNEARVGLAVAPLGQVVQVPVRLKSDQGMHAAQQPRGPVPRSTRAWPKSMTPGHSLVISAAEAHQRASRGGTDRGCWVRQGPSGFRGAPVVASAPGLLTIRRIVRPWGGPTQVVPVSRGPG
jgi:hypothetical protein